MPAPKTETIARLVHAVRGERVLFDADLADLYGVTTKALNQAVKRNRARFPARLHVPSGGRGVVKLEVTNCDLKCIYGHEVTNCDHIPAER